MSEAKRGDERDEECLKLLVEHGVQPDDARHVLESIKQKFDAASAQSEPAAQASEPVMQFRRNTRKKAGKGHMVAGAPFEEFKQYADAHQWKDRKPWMYDEPKSVFFFIRDVYGKWMKRGEEAMMPLAQADIKAVDPALYDHMHRASTTHGRPDWFHLPSASEAALVGLSAEERDLRLARKEYDRQSRQARIAKKEGGTTFDNT